MFEIVTPENSATITLNDNLDDAKRYSRVAAPPATWIIGRGAKAVGWAVFSYAKINGIPARDVGYKVEMGS